MRLFTNQHATDPPTFIAILPLFSNYFLMMNFSFFGTAQNDTKLSNDGGQNWLASAGHFLERARQLNSILKRQNVRRSADSRFCLPLKLHGSSLVEAQSWSCVEQCWTAHLATFFHRLMLSIHNLVSLACCSFVFKKSFFFKRENLSNFCRAFLAIFPHQNDDKIWKTGDD